MTLEEIKQAVLKLSPADQKRLILEVVPEIWGEACKDEACVLKIRSLVDEDTVKKYRQQHMNGI
ncbi:MULTISPECIES: hypothetical protein [Desulfococcus]|uniref:Uncharacterized protein n=1 Tax=Desulfococcus multivorans DSM 2059 TaxID=1121405 RepID=S7TPW0_DESML|nr:hypothetical protein [Desulfococcus multivorans]AOY57908.1 conserved uncharacterized protein [Desulfococcus multivorans]AQV00285.1 hypothetical protein B2D07_05520 [Desulfococcus multivorans]EPR38991.1 hypothetical protein dsmv_0401 [Desulfococcus multivorans DSM 2059]SJZ65469.1 hypothetical protein SAMN02745446_01250 [Desulfococcus multivorans DSM 2059]